MIAIEHRVAVYDTIYVALAAELGAAFVTADRKLVRALAERSHAGRVRGLADVTFPLPRTP